MSYMTLPKFSDAALRAVRVIRSRAGRTRCDELQWNRAATLELLVAHKGGWPHLMGPHTPRRGVASEQRRMNPIEP